MKNHHRNSNVLFDDWHEEANTETRINSIFALTSIIFSFFLVSTFLLAPEFVFFGGILLMSTGKSHTHTKN